MMGDSRARRGAQVRRQRRHVRRDAAHRRAHTADGIGFVHARGHVVAPDGDRDEPDVPAMGGEKGFGRGDLCRRRVGHPAPGVGQDGGTSDRVEDGRGGGPGAAEVGQGQVRPPGHVDGVAGRGSQPGLVPDRVRVAERHVVGGCRRAGLSHTREEGGRQRSEGDDGPNRYPHASMLSHRRGKPPDGRGGEVRVRRSGDARASAPASRTNRVTVRWPWRPAACRSGTPGPGRTRARGGFRPDPLPRPPRQ